MKILYEINAKRIEPCYEVQSIASDIIAARETKKERKVTISVGVPRFFFSCHSSLLL